MAPKSKPRTPSRPQASTYPMTPVPQPNLPPFNFNTNTTPTPAKASQPAQEPVKVKLLGIANSGLESACLLQVGESTLYLKSGDVVQTNTGELRIISVRPTKVRLITPQGPLTLTTPGAQVSIEAKRPVALTHRLDNTPSPASSQAGSGQVALKPVAEPPDIYVVQPGDTLYSISRRYFGSPRYVRTLAKMNHLRNPSVIYVGQRLVLRSGARPVAAGRSWLQTAPRVASPRQQVSAPAIRKGEVKLYKVQPGDTLYKISRRFYGNITGAKKLARSNGIKNPNLIHPNMVLRIEL
jgi:nucleoid-associated protein YgaU